MNIQKEVVFKTLQINLESIEEVKELQAVLAKVNFKNDFIDQIYTECQKITDVPMSGLYAGKIQRMHD